MPSTIRTNVASASNPNLATPTDLSVPDVLVSTADNITAFAGGGQGSAVALTALMNRVTTVGTAADSVKLPAAVPGLAVYVTNAAAANSMNVFPQTGEAINALSANTAFAIAANKVALFLCHTAGRWHSILTA